MDISHFIDDVRSGYITDYDGCGEYVYTDEKCQLWVDEDNSINFNEINCSNVDAFIENKSNDKYKLLGVFWYNK